MGVKMAHFTIIPNDQLLEYLLLGRMTLAYVGLEAWVPKEGMLPLGHQKTFPFWSWDSCPDVLDKQPLDKQAKNKQELARVIALAY